MRFNIVLEMPGKPIHAMSIFECIGRQDFVITYDFQNCNSIIGIGASHSESTKQSIMDQISGIKFSTEDSAIQCSASGYSVFSVYKQVEKNGEKFFSDAFNILPKEGFLSIIFAYADMQEVSRIKVHLEDMISSKSIRKSEMVPGVYIGSKSGLTIHKEIYNESEERLVLGSMLESLNGAVLGNGLAYKIFILIPKGYENIRNYIETHFLVLAEYSFNNSDMHPIISQLCKKSSIPYGALYAGEYANFYGLFSINHAIHTAIPQQIGSIAVGSIVSDGVAETGIKAMIEPSSINLGFLMTGLPGSGKTMEAMSVIHSLLNSNERLAVFVVTPTKEWKEFALSHDISLISPYSDDTPINFFRCPTTIEQEKFYSNLAMILASAANAGPYRNPMEKCMLNAFRHVYSENVTEPAPAYVYSEIEKSIIKYHGKKTNVGIKYTKHGENIKSALENLRSILSKGQYCVEKGIKFEDFMERGAVFDVSAATANTTAQLYSLILNQIYSLAEKFDENGDGKLRMLICLEEAQTIFSDPYSPAVQDIKQRIQDFRKKGIGLMLLTHNVSDIEIGIRRLCQLKLYLKQAPDTAATAAKDLIFTYADNDDVVLKLKSLPSRIGAFSCVSGTGSERRQHDTLFVKTESYYNDMQKSSTNPIDSYIRSTDIRPARLIKCKISIKGADYKDIKNDDIKEFKYIRISFLGEEIQTIPLAKITSNVVQLLNGIEHTVEILSKSGKVLRELSIRVSEDIKLDIMQIAQTS